MKKIFTLFFGILFALAIFTQNAQALTFEGENYNLIFATNKTPSGGWVNKFTRKGETARKWTKLINVHTFPMQKVAQGPTQSMAKLLAGSGLMAQVTYDPQNDIGMIDYIIANDDFVEFNIFKYEKNKQGEVVAMQFTFRTTAKEVRKNNNFADTVKQNRIKWLQEVRKTQIPDVVKKEVQ